MAGTQGSDTPQCHIGRRLVCLLLIVAGGGGVDGVCQADGSGPDPVQYRETVERGIQYLSVHRADDGSLSGQLGIGPTALATLALLQLGRSPDDPEVARGLAYLEEFSQESGGIHAPGSRLSNYETCVAVVCLQKANRPARFGKVLHAADTFLRDGQWDEHRGKKKEDLYYGGTGYGGNSRPDLSNTAFLVEALRSCGAKPDDPAIQKALVFVSRCQNLESPHNTTAFAGKINDGGFYYTCVLERNDGSREQSDGGLRSYGAMSYSGLKSLVYAGLTKDDSRVKEVVTWIGKHYDVSTHPGMGDAGLFYYYHSFAKALDVLGSPQLEDAQGQRHDWRHDLTAELARRQKPDGSWVNDNLRWMEGDPNLATAFALLALSHCRPGPEEPPSKP